MQIALIFFEVLSVVADIVTIYMLIVMLAQKSADRNEK